MKCPCCGSEVPEVPVAALLEATQGPVALSILKLLVSRYPKGISMEQIIAYVYNMAPDTPEFPVNSICMTLIKMRKSLKEAGWSITGGKGGRATQNRYRLEPLA